MMKAVKLSALVAVAALATGCASTSDLEALDARVGALEGKVTSLDGKVTSAASDAAAAKLAADRAESAANRANLTAQEISTKLDRMFKKSQHK